jgi:hypothetical protein
VSLRQHERRAFALAGLIGCPRLILPAATTAPRCRRLSWHKRPGLAHDPALHRSSAPPEPCNARSRAEARSVFGTLLMLVQAPAARTEGSRLVGAGRLQFNACLPQFQRSVRCHARIRRLCDTPGRSVACGLMIAKKDHPPIHHFVALTRRGVQTKQEPTEAQSFSILFVGEPGGPPILIATFQRRVSSP